jgi:hypothetical protein
MTWQDVVISSCQLVAVFSLIPSITSNDKPALKTSAMNLILVLIIGNCLATLDLWFAATTAYLIAFSWGVLAYQKYRIDKDNV